MTDKQCKRCGKVNPAEIHTCTPKEQEPVGWMYSTTGTLFDTCPQDADEGEFLPLYITPQRREWVGLTDEDRMICEQSAKGNYFALCAAVEAKLKEKNSGV
jgi:hypothetical protein